MNLRSKKQQRGIFRKKSRVPATRRCPVCKIGRAINKREAYRSFHSKKIAKLRKQKSSRGKPRGPQVGTYLTAKGALLNPEILDLISPPKFFSDNEIDRIYEPLRKAVLILLGVIGTGFLIRGSAGSEADFVIAIFIFTVWVLLFHRGGIIRAILDIIDMVRLTRLPRDYKLYAKTWLCLRCSHEWIETK
jgi:hypothetical protein